ncbi:MAG: TetR/AcrR family transcriptional regulator [Pseudomonadota bacterium]
MARPREFNEDNVIDAAMHCFWQNGFDGATISDLEEATGISRISLYNTFKDKEGLYLAAQRRYQEMAFKMLREMLAVPELSSLNQFFSLHLDGDPRQEAAHLGCMMVNTVLDSTNVSEQVLQYVRSYREGLTDLFEEYLEQCKDCGVIRNDLDLRACASFIQTSMWGAMAVSRLYHDFSENLPHVSIVLDTIDSWRVHATAR